MSRTAAIALPDDVRSLLEGGAALAVNVSGGKDSQALAIALSSAHQEHAWPGPIFVLHADLGRAEWPQTPAFVERIARESNLPLRVVRRTKGDLVQRIQERAATLAETDTPHWPSAANRYCTSHLKADPANTELRKAAAPHWPSSAARYCTSDLKRGPSDTAFREYTAIVSAEGVRGQESKKRAKKPTSEPRNQIVTLTRVALNWRPLKEWTIDDVWALCGTSAEDLSRRRALWNDGHTLAAMDGWPCHPAYVLGNERLSCGLCVLASKNDLLNGLRYTPSLARDYIIMERETGFTFKADLSLEQLAIDAGLLGEIMGDAA